MVFYNSDKISSLEGKFLVGALRGQHLMVLDIANDGSLISAEKMFEAILVEFALHRLVQMEFCIY